MSLERQLIEKTYYQMFINEHEQAHPIRVLGEAIHAELQKEMADLSYIRFAQGEVYFHHKDYETAIFKWGNITNELAAWARKNMADAYFESGLHTNAEELYLAIHTDDLTLNTEISLKLFSLYIQQQRMEDAKTVIKRTVDANPDYPSVTERARIFFEGLEDWPNAVELAVNEAKRTGSQEWFQTLKLYVERGNTKQHEPYYFTQTLAELFQIDKKLFQELVASFWQSYKLEATYLAWLKEINYLLLNLDLNREDEWGTLSRLHKETYMELIDGKRFIKQLGEFVPDLLTNWQRLAYSNDLVFAPAAVLSWSELFPASISSAITEDAEKLLSQTEHNLNEFEECLTLIDDILKWAKFHEMGENFRLKWIVDQLNDLQSQHLFVTGFSGSGKSAFINTILGEELQDSPTSSIVCFKDHEEVKISDISNEEMEVLEGFTEFQERMDRRRGAMESIIEFNQPFPFLYESQLAILDTPGFNGARNEVLNYLQVADIILFVLDGNSALTEKERAILTQMQTLAPDIPIHFLLNKMDAIPNEEEAVRIQKEVSEELGTLVPDAKLFAFSKQLNGQQLADLKEFIKSIKETRTLKDKRLSKLLYFIRATISSLLQKRIDVENKLIDSVRWNEEMLQKLTGGINQLKDTESQQANAVIKSYQAIKDSMEKDISEAIPGILKNCSELITEKSDYSKIHLELNQEMNKRLQDYLEQDVLPKYFYALQEWIRDSKEVFNQSQAFLEEMAAGFNQIFGEERLKLVCDFKVLEDWRRDMDRMTSRFQLGNINILLKRTPAQMLLKSAGKLLGALSQNKTMLYNKYKSFVENEDYTETMQEVIERFFQQFELFENALERDVSLFFRNPLVVLEKAADGVRAEIDSSSQMLKKINTNPEMFRDPLTLFEIRLRQFEWLTVAGKGIQTVY